MARMPASVDQPAPPLPHRHSRGVTLIEMIVAMSVVAILAALAVPSFRALSKRNRVDTTLHLLTSHFASARIAAITHNVPVVICPSGGDGTCRQDSDWSDHWLTFRDPDGNRQPDETIDLYRNDPAPRSPRLRIYSTAGRRELRYLPTGYSSGSNLTLRVCYDGEVSGLVVVNNAGRVRTARPKGSEPCGEAPDSL
ncbi:GspH/FimT family pseudopilin [Pseudoxanthomonas sp. LjRoot125]|uniref:GspH/FimT family pseudopilin n=1 Tax=Pseudoxanthomonas sp. LjRoot125 TaxID=3342258 RepID=UPI003EBDF620